MIAMRLPPIRATWARLVALVVWLSAAIASFLAFPFQLTLESDHDLRIVAFAQFLGAVVVALVLVYSEKQVGKPRVLRRGVFALLILFCGTFFTYEYLQSDWTCRYASRFVLIKGDALSADAASYVKEHPGIASCESLIAEYGGNTRRIYSESDLRFRFFALALIYSIVWTIAVALVVMTTQLFRKSGKQGRPLRKAGG